MRLRWIMLLIGLLCCAPARARAQVGWYGITNSGYYGGYAPTYNPYSPGNYSSSAYAWQSNYYSAGFQSGAPAFTLPYTPSYYYSRSYAKPDFVSGGSFYTPGSYAVPAYARPSYYYSPPAFYGPYYFRP